MTSPDSCSRNRLANSEFPLSTTHPLERDDLKGRQAPNKHMRVNHSPKALTSPVGRLEAPA